MARKRRILFQLIIDNEAKCRKYNSSWIKEQLQNFSFLVIDNFIDRSVQSYF